MKALLSFAFLAFSICTVSAADQFVCFKQKSSAQLRLSGSRDTIVYDSSDWEGVKMAVANLRNDLMAVTGSSHAPIVVGTVDKSRYAAKYKAIADSLRGKWEQYVITTDENKLVIIGSDKRGTIYGIYELSRQIGVSPWYWWADAPIAHHDDIYVDRGTYTDGEPAVKYRGIFINDEWPSFGTWATNHFGGINAKMYGKMFELLLRLRANYLWPAMWDSRFNEDDPDSPALADKMGIVMGTSHHEPMMRAHKEYVTRRDEVGPWDYATNPNRLDKFFTDGIHRNKSYENIVTIGMRGDGDVAMGKGNDADNMKTLKEVISSQRRIISKEYGQPAENIPQLWAIFTEVQRYYDAGFTVPDDVTLLLCDNNWGYIRRIGRDFERKRTGGLGLYYHIDMNGGPWNDRWVNTTTLPKLREQLNLAYSTGLDRIWIINVGDLKPKEVPIDFIMNYAWNPKAIQPGDEQRYLERFAASVFGEHYASDIAHIISKYSKYNLLRKPEVQVPGIFNRKEMQRMHVLWTDLAEKAEALRHVLPAEAQDAFYQLVYYPTVASANVAEIYNAATHGDSLEVERLIARDHELTDYYNKQIAAGKWDGIMLDNHIGYTQWSIPDKNINPVSLHFPTSHLNSGDKPTSETIIPAYHFKKNVEGTAARWIFLPDLGRGVGCMGADNVMASSNTSGRGAMLEYDVEDMKSLAIAILPTQDIYPARGLRLGVQIDDEPMMVIDARQGLYDLFQEYTQQNLAVSKVLKPLPNGPKLALNGWFDGRQLPRRTEVFDNMRWLSIPIGEEKKGTHTVRLIMIDPEIVVEQIAVNPDNSHYSYFGGN